MAEDSLAIGTDEWVAAHEERTSGQGQGQVARRFARVPWWVWAGTAIVVAVVLPLFGSTYLTRVGVNLGLFMMLALGLNLVVGYAGLLDIGYVAFYGLGAYGFAMLASGKFGVHLPTVVAVPLVVAGVAIFGLVLGLAARRLLGDYLAIVTLFFGQMFVEFTLSGDAITVPGRAEQIDLTGGTNGITDVDRFSFFGVEFSSDRWYYYLLVALVALLALAVRRLDGSRIGRAWKAIGQDPLAAEAMTMPVNRLKILAFVVGAGIAGLGGTIFAAVQRGVFPSSFDLPLLILLYAAVILGGSGSLRGALIGAALLSLLPEALRQPSYSEIVFVLLLVAGLALAMKSWRDRLLVVVTTVVLGFVMNLLFTLLHVQGVPARVWTDGFVSKLLGHWLFVPQDRVLWGNIGFVALVVLLAVLTLVGTRVRPFLLSGIVWLSVFVWFVRLADVPSVTRQLLIGALLIVLMVVRPQGLFGRRQVEVL
jgi:branched-chain amino acid transport system permease protein